MRVPKTSHAGERRQPCNSSIASSAGQTSMPGMDKVPLMRTVTRSPCHRWVMARKLAISIIEPLATPPSPSPSQHR